MKDKKKIKINLGSLFSKVKKIKIKKGRLRVYIIILLVIIVLLLSTLLKPLFYSDSIKRVRSWNVSEDYNLGVAADDVMKNVKWKSKDGVVTLTGKDKETGEKVVITFKVGDNMAFDSMTLNGKSYEYFEWENYMRSYLGN